MAELHVTITADGVERDFHASGDGAVVVAAFRSWLASSGGESPMAEGADAIDVGASTIERTADDYQELDLPGVRRWLLKHVAEAPVSAEDLFVKVQVQGVPRSRFMQAMRDLLDGGKIFGRRADDGEISLSTTPNHE